MRASLLLALFLLLSACRGEAPAPTASAPTADLTGVWAGQAGWFSAQLDLRTRDDVVSGTGQVTGSPLSGSWTSTEYRLGISANGTFVGGNWSSGQDAGLASGQYEHPDVRLYLQSPAGAARDTLTEVRATLSDDAAFVVGRYVGGPFDGAPARFAFTGRRPLHGVLVKGLVDGGQVLLEIEPIYVFVGRFTKDGTLQGTVGAEQLQPLPLTLYRVETGARATD